jgi:DNA-binding LytR/AlgR family response regulator
MKVLIIEDEQPNARMLAEMLQNLRPGWEISGIMETVKQSVAWLHVNPHPDLILMDIQLSDGICFSIFEQVEVKSSIIFTTAFDNYAIQAFKVNSIDYLLKPVKESELEKALIKLEQFRQPAHQQIDFSEIVQAMRTGKKEYRKRFLISAGNKYFKLNTSEIACFISENKVTTAVTFTGEQHVVDFSLDKLEDELDPEIYFRADRKTIIHIDLVSRFEDYFGSKLIVKLKSPVNDNITVSRLKASAFKVWVGK